MGSPCRSISSQSYQTFTAEINCNYFQLGAIRGRILAPGSLFEMLNQNCNDWTLAVSNFHFVKLYLKYISIDVDVAIQTRVDAILMRAEA